MTYAQVSQPIWDDYDDDLDYPYDYYERDWDDEDYWYPQIEEIPESDVHEDVEETESETK